MFKEYRDIREFKEYREFNAITLISLNSLNSLNSLWLCRPTLGITCSYNPNVRAIAQIPLFKGGFRGIVYINGGVLDTTTILKATKVSFGETFVII